MNTYEIIKNLAATRKISISELERRLNLSNGSISKWSKSRPAAERLEAVANFFNVSTNYLLGKDEKSNVSTADLSDDDVIFTYEGKPIPKEDLDLIRRLMRGTRNDI